MTKDQLSVTIDRIQTFIAAKTEEELDSVNDHHSLLYNDGYDTWHFKFCETLSPGLGIFIDGKGGELIISCEEIKVIYINSNGE